ncbi:DUF7683 domain-containing protein [Pseudomonas knackmussii]|uniref:DUF7683 domain-containing protein n=1 Tax=Pseudomonas knackmussii TaxID=65741 RepID=UPI003BE449DE
MRYFLEAFDAETEFLVFEVEVPASFEKQLTEVMGWNEEQFGFEGYDLDEQKLSLIERFIGKRLADPRYTFQLTCNL